MPHPVGEGDRRAGGRPSVKIRRIAPFSLTSSVSWGLTWTSMGRSMVIMPGMARFLATTWGAPGRTIDSGRGGRTAGRPRGFWPTLPRRASGTRRCRAATWGTPGGMRSSQTRSPPPLHTLFQSATSDHLGQLRPAVGGISSPFWARADRPWPFGQKAMNTTPSVVFLISRVHSVFPVTIRTQTKAEPRDSAARSREARWIRPGPQAESDSNRPTISSP